MIISLLITFVVGVNIVGVDFYKFFAKFQNAGGIASGIFDPSVTGYSLSAESINELEKEDIPPDVLNTLILNQESVPSGHRKTDRQRLPSGI